MSTTKFRFVHARKGNFDHDGNGLIQFRIYKHRKYRYVSTGLSVRIDQWSDEEQGVIRHNQQIKYNLHLQKIKTAGQQYHANYIGCQAEDIKQHLIAKFAIGNVLFKSTNEDQSVRDYLINKTGFKDLKTAREFVNKIERRYSSYNRPVCFIDFCCRQIILSDLEPKTISQEKILVSYLIKFSNTIKFTDITYSLVDRFSKFLAIQKSIRGEYLHPNYIASILAKMRKFVNEAMRREYVDKSPFLNFIITKSKTKKVSLTQKELEKWESCDVSKIDSGARLFDTWKNYLFCIYSGLRYGDAMSLIWDDFTANEKGLSIKKTPKKTKRYMTEVDIPLYLLFGGKAQLLLNMEDETPLNRISNKSFNDNIRTIAKHIGIQKHLTVHTSRHTFATLLTEKGVPIEVIKTLMGHRSVTTTEVYSKVGSGAIEKGLEGRF